MNNLHIFFYWVIVSFVLLLFEIGHPGLFFFSAFSIGALSAAFASLLFYSGVVQGCIFLIATICALVILRYWVAHYVHRGQEHYHSNVYALIGKRAVVIMEITANNPGEVKVDGEVWVARLTDANESVGVGSLVEIVGVSGSHLKVKMIN
jgi:membrane protein implicated in regulation of membrane protease activity